MKKIKLKINQGLFSLILILTNLLINPVQAFCQVINQNNLAEYRSFEDSCLLIGEQFIDKIEHKKFHELPLLFSDRIMFRALIPSSLVTSNDPEVVARRFYQWFYVDDSEKYEMIDTQVNLLVDCLHIYYQIFTTWKGVPHKIEQHLYAEIRNGKINNLSLVCSGGRKIIQ